MFYSTSRVSRGRVRAMLKSDSDERGARLHFDRVIMAIVSRSVMEAAPHTTLGTLDASIYGLTS